jgi:hypothetical protein
MKHKLAQNVRWDLAGIAQAQIIRKQDPESYFLFFDEEKVLERHTGFSRQVAQHLMGRLSTDSEIIEYAEMCMRVFGYWPYKKSKK